MWLLLVGVFSLCAGAWALHDSDVGVVDWHREFIGVPLSGSVSTSPSFHHAENKSFIVAATSSNVLAALEPEDGSILWRYVFNPEDRIAGYFKHDSVIATLSGPGGSTLRAFNATNGQLLHEKRMHNPDTEPADVGNDVVFADDSADLYVLSNGSTVSRIDANAHERWTVSHKGIVHTRLVLNGDALYAIGVAKITATSYTLQVTALNASTGQVLHSSGIATNIVGPWKESRVVLNPSLQLPVAVWLDKGALRYVPLTPKLNGKPKSAQGSGFVRIVDVGLASRGQLVAVRQDGSGVLYQLDGEPTGAKVVGEYDNGPSAKENSESFYAAAFDERGHPHVARIFPSGSLQRGSSGHADRAIPHDVKKYGAIQNIAFDSSSAPHERTIKSRFLLVASTGALQLWDADRVRWTREEALADVPVAELVEIPQSILGETSPAVGDSEDFVARIRRQISDAKGFPQYVVNFINRFTGGSLPIPTSRGTATDPFGFRQVIVVATKLGKVYGIDSSNGEIIWSRALGFLGWAEGVQAVVPVKICTIKTVSDGGDPEVALVTQRKADDGSVDTVIFHFNALTGRDVAGRSDEDDLSLEGRSVISGPLVESFFLDHDQKMLVLLDESLQVHLYPDSPKTQSAFQGVVHRLSFPLPMQDERGGGSRAVVGHQLFSSSSNPATAYPTWSLALRPDESIQALVPASRGPVASFGKVLGDRTTLYKYLNPRLFAVLTSFSSSHREGEGKGETTTATKRCGLYVVDGAKGAILYRVEVDAVSSSRPRGGGGGGGGCEMKVVLVENWLVFHYYENEIGEGAKGYRVVSVEFYEGQGVDEKTRSIELSAFHNETLNFHTYEQAYVLSSGITAIASTTTRFGISNKDLVVATKDNKIKQLPRVLLNPRRPNRRPTTEEQEESLVEYHPVLPDDPKAVLSHNYKVTNVQNIITSPSLLESTTLVYAYGLDMFLTRVAPSGTFDVLSETFNKAQLVCTVFGLLVAVVATRPIVRRKRLREKWYQ